MAVEIVRNSLGTFAGTSQRMYIYSESTGVVLQVPYAPREIAFDGWNSTWVETERSGASPLLLRKGDQLETMKFALSLVNTDSFFAQTGIIATIKALARTRERVLVRFGPNEAGLWRITDLSLTSQQRHPDTSEITQGVASFTLTQASDAAPAVGPVNPPPPPAPPVTKPAQTAVRRYTVVRGDCLWKIAQRYYGNGALWPRIYDANRTLIKKPELIYPGQIFVIP